MAFVMTGTIFHLQRFSLHDGPGIRTTVFLKGCPLRCAWCHNPESQLPQPELIFRENRCCRCGACATSCPQQAITMNGQPETDLSSCTRCGVCVDNCYAGAREMAGFSTNVERLVQEIEKDRPFYEASGGGLTFSGGEPLAQAEFVAQVLQACKKQNIHTALDTCGYANWQDLDQLRHFVDLFLFDLKIMDETRHVEQVGVSNFTILENLQRLSKNGQDIIIRVPIIPGITDDPENIAAISKFVKALPTLHKIEILPYHNMTMQKYARLGREYPLRNIKSPDIEKMEKIKQYMQQYDLQVEIGG